MQYNYPRSIAILPPPHQPLVAIPHIEYVTSAIPHGGPPAQIITGHNNIRPPVQYYNYPSVVGSALDSDNTMDKWSDLFQRVNDELATDTMELSNLENQVEIWMDLQNIRD